MAKGENGSCEKESTIIQMARTPIKSSFSINALLPEITSAPPSELSPSPSTISEQDYSDGDVNVDMDSDAEGIYHLQSFQCDRLFFRSIRI